MMISKISGYTPAGYNTPTRQTKTKTQSFSRNCNSTYCYRLEKKIEILKENNVVDMWYLKDNPTETEVVQKKIKTRNQKIAEYEKLRNYERDIIEKYLDLDEKLTKLYKMFEDSRSTSELEKTKEQIADIIKRKEDLLKRKY